VKTYCIDSDTLVLISTALEDVVWEYVSGFIFPSQCIYG